MEGLVYGKRPQEADHGYFLNLPVKLELSRPNPILSYQSTVLGREQAIVINLEHIKAIITAQEVLLLNLKDPSVTPFVDEL
ncbi:magnesium transporter MRS2-3-like protein [Tanacetum coccineum]